MYVKKMAFWIKISKNINFVDLGRLKKFLVKYKKINAKYIKSCIVPAYITK